MFNSDSTQAFFDGFQVNGIIVEKRTLTSQKNKEWSMEIVKIATIGKVFEMQADDAGLLTGFSEGDSVICHGCFDFRNNIPLFKLASMVRFGDGGTSGKK